MNRTNHGCVIVITSEILPKAKACFQFNPVEYLTTILGVMSSGDIVNRLVKELKKHKKSN